jgi:hypothetical protein
MRWALVGLALLLAVAGLLYRGGLAFVSSLSVATASESPRADGPGTVAATTGQMAAATWSERGPTADRSSASGMPGPGPSPGPQPVASPPEDSSPSANEQRMFKSRRALETVDPREFLRQGTK